MAEDSAEITRIHSDIALVAINMKTKRGKVVGYCSDAGLMLDKCDCSIRTHQTMTGLTVVELPEFVGWNPICADYSRYTVYVCLTKSKGQ